MSRRPNSGLRLGAIASGLLHLLVLVVLVFGLPELFRPLPEPPQPISVEIVDLITDVSNPPPPKRLESVVPPKPTTKPLPPADEVVETPAPKAAAVPEPQPETPPDPPEAPQVAVDVPPPPPEPVKEPLPEPPKPVEKPKPEPPKPEKPKPVEKPKPKPEKPKPKKPEQPKQQEDILSDLDALLNKDTPKPGAPPPPDAQVSDKPNRQTERGQPDKPLSMSEKDFIIAQLQQCWVIDPGAAGVAEMSVTIRAFYNPSGQLLGNPEIISRSGNATTAFVDRAYRALFKQKCNPMRFPPGKYDAWKELRITFTPTEMAF